MSKKAIWIGATIGSTVGGCVPSLWHAGMFSFSGVILSTIGALLGIWITWKLMRG